MYRQMLEAAEIGRLSPLAVLSSKNSGRIRAEEDDPLRTCFQVDRDRVIHSKSFRRLKHKTQVFYSPAGDHYRTRLTHTIEVSTIARTIARCLRLNEDLTEAIALAHDLGHTPFGHAGERVLNELSSTGFKHVRQSLRVVDLLENDGKGLNLTEEVRDGILKHSKGKGAILPGRSGGFHATMEAEAVRISDLIAYLNHDLDDAIRAGILTDSEIPSQVIKVLGSSEFERSNRAISSILRQTERMSDGALHVEADTLGALEKLRSFLFERVYEAPVVEQAYRNCRKVIRDLFAYFVEFPKVREIYYKPSFEAEIEEHTIDFIAGMTDNYILRLYEELFLPQKWRLS